MATPGIGDPYWFEWYVGLKNIINMLNPDNGIEYVIFQCSKYNTIDDVVVGYKDGGHEICYQIKHEIFTSKTQNLTFGKLLEQETKTKPCLLCAIVQHELNSSKIMSQPDDFTKRFDEEKQQIHVEYGEMSYNEILQSLPQTAYLSNATERFRTISNFQKIGDCLLPAAIDEEDRILYSAEKDGRWVEIPLLQKKCWLLPSDDPYLLTEMPHMVFDDSWFPCISDSYGEKSDIRINKDQFSKIVHGNRPVGEIVLGACVWYPWNDDDGKLYIETAKIDTNTLSPYRSDKVDPCFGNYGLLAHEGALVEFGGDFAHINGASLFKVVGGNMFFYLCNSQIAPSEIWREGFKCVPDHTSPYCWRDENGNIVLRFERIASPIREAMHEKYYRQPILFRWLCNSEWLKETLCKHNLHLRYVSRLESIP